MRHPIDPTVDGVFRALFGAEANRDLLIHFLNAVLAADLPAPITAVELLNPSTSGSSWTTSCRWWT